MTKALIFDVENTTYLRPDKTRDFSPFYPSNKLVSIGWGWVENGGYTEAAYEYFYHKAEPPCPTKVTLAREAFQQALDEADIVVGFNLRHDMQWVLSCGFNYDGPIFDCMVAEYILQRGQKRNSLSLEATAERYDVFRKKGDLVRDYLDREIQFDEIPVDVVTEYGSADVRSTGELYIKLLEEYSGPSKGMARILDLANEFCAVLTEMEMNGIKIDKDALDAVEKEFRDEQVILQERLQKIAYDVMQDRPINLGSPEQLSWVIYSRKVNDKAEWKRIFNIGKDERGKDLRRPKMSPTDFAKAVKDNVTRLRKQTAEQCYECHGVGKVRKVKKNGEAFKKDNICSVCKGAGFLYHDTNSWAGFKFSPRDVNDCAVGGFATDKGTLKLLKMKAEEANDELAVEFLGGIIRLNAIDTYLSNFVGGIRRGLLDDGLLHTRFNQTITSTGRLSSSDPNLQNQPREATFPIKRAFVSRFDGGEVWECDYAGLEFAVAGEIFDDPVIKRMIATKEDAHKKTASIIHGISPKDVTKDQRQAAKEHTFAPLYGASGHDLPKHIARYYQEFTKTYPGVGKGHVRLQDEAINSKKIVLPDGKEFAFPSASRTKSGGSTYATQIKNYPIQYFATGMIVPLAVVRMGRLLRQHKMKSLLTLTVHDSLVLDRHPDDDKVQLVKLIVEACDVKQEIYDRFGYTMSVPLGIEIAGGPSWLSKKVIPHHDLDIQDEIPF